MSSNLKFEYGINIFFCSEHCTRARATGVKAIAWMHAAVARYGARRRARAGGSPPPCRTWPLRRGWPARRASRRTQASAGTAPPLNWHPSSRLIC